MSETNSMDLKPLETDYEIVAELWGREDARSFVARRRSDGRDVMIAIVGAREGESGNALSHVAADANLLRGMRHPNLLPVLDARWMGDRFAVITERVDLPTLEEALDLDPGFSKQRIATVLQEVNSVLAWGREHGVVHRGVTPHTVFVESGTNRVLVTFAYGAVPVTGSDDPTVDARAIGALAWRMLAGAPYTPESAEEGLASRRPDLATRVVADTEAVLRCGPGTGAPDIPQYIAVLAMGDALREAEMEIERLRAECDEGIRAAREEMRLEQNACEARAAETERELEAQRVAFGKEMEKARAQLDQEREKLARQLAKEREKLAAEREKLATEREKLAAERERLAERRAKLKQAAAAAAAAAPMDVDDDDDPRAGLGDAAPDEPLDAYPDASRVRASTAATTLALSPEPGLADGPELVPSSKPRKRWYLPAIFTGGAALVVAAGIGISQYRDGSRAERSITPARTETSAQSSPMSRAEPLWSGAATVDSAGGTISSSVPVMPPTQPYIPRGVSIPAARPYAAVGAEPPIAGGSVDRIGTSSGSSQTVPPVMRVGTESTPPRMDVPPRPDSPRVVPTTPAPGIDTAAIRRLMNGLRVLTPRPDSLGRPDTGIRRPPVIPPPDTGRYR